MIAGFVHLSFVVHHKIVSLSDQCMSSLLSEKFLRFCFSFNESDSLLLNVCNAQHMRYRPIFPIHAESWRHKKPWVLYISNTREREIPLVSMIRFYFYIILSSIAEKYQCKLNYLFLLVSCFLKHRLQQSEEGTSQLRIKIISGQSLAKKDIFGAR